MVKPSGFLKFEAIFDTNLFDDTPTVQESFVEFLTAFFNCCAKCEAL